MSGASPNLILCNGAEQPAELKSSVRVHTLDYLDNGDERPHNVTIGLPSFVRDVYHLPDRILDLLELASYVFAADRLIDRGALDLVEYHSWGRELRFVVRVRDIDFWSRLQVRDALSRCLVFMTGDQSIEFTFQEGHSTPPTNLFDIEGFSPPAKGPLSVMLFSGGADSLAGAISVLEETEDRVCLVSHQSSSSTKRTQTKLVEALQRRYSGRVWHYPFESHLTGVRAQEESQRSRSFLYCSIACAIAHAFESGGMAVHENGITSLNFPRRGDLANARASRTTHPKAIQLLSEVLNLVFGEPFQIRTPFFWLTKSDVLQKFDEYDRETLLSSSVSCSGTLKGLGPETHCGECSQCIDRRLAAFACRLDDWDEGNLYQHDMIRSSVTSRRSRTTLVDYLRQARKFAVSDVDHFYEEYSSELAEVVPYLQPKNSELETVERIWELCNRHGRQISRAIRVVREAHDDPYAEIPENSLLDVVSNRAYLQPPVDSLVSDLCERLGSALPKMFARRPPEDEPDLNAKISGILDGYEEEIRSEHPSVRFACARVVPDHSFVEYDLLIEAKFIRGNTTPSKASEGVAADLTKLPEECHKLFLIYDPQRAIKDDREFRIDFESKGDCTIDIIR